jgi:hypothetical protein
MGWPAIHTSRVITRDWKKLQNGEPHRAATSQKQVKAALYLALHTSDDI